MKTIHLPIVLIAITGGSLIAQENQGIAFDNYNPVNGQFINPTHIVDSKAWLDINLIGGSVFGRNNVMYYPDNKWLKVNSFNQDPVFKTTLNNINGYVDMDIKGPSATLVLGRHSVSVYSGVRGMMNVNKVPGVLAKFATNGGLEVSDTGTYTVNNARLKSMVWGEIGVTYGKILSAQGDNMWVGAISIKRLFGMQNAALLVDDALARVPTTDNTTLLSTNGTFSYAEPDLNAGKGWGMNLGVTYKKMKSDVTRYVPHSKVSGCQQIDYQYKIGVSLIDVGYINFDQNAYYGAFNETTNVDDLNSANDLSNEFQANQQGTKFRAWIPAAASVQFDYNLNDRIYFNGTVIQRIPMANTFGVERANMLAVSARYETKYFGIGIPFTMQNYIHPQMGLALRFANVTIGSDNLLPIFFNHNELLAGDIYFSVKHTFYKSPQCKDKKSKSSSNSRRKKSRGSKRNSVDCPAF